jgi:hypothetical protein
LHHTVFRIDQISTPWSRRIDQHPPRHLPFCAGFLVAQGNLPLIFDALGTDTFGARQDFRAKAVGINGIKHHQTRIIDPAIGIDKTLRHAITKRRTRYMLGK